MLIEFFSSFENDFDERITLSMKEKANSAYLGNNA